MRSYRITRKYQIGAIFGLTRPGLEPMIYHTLGEYTNHYTTAAVNEINKLGG